MEWKRDLCAVLSIMMLAGCTGTTTAGSTSASVSEDAEDGVVIQIDADLSTMDHIIAYDGNSFLMQSVCFSGLASLDDNGLPQEELAESWEVSDDGLTYTFHLNEDATWSNGTPVTANDFVFAWQRLDDPATASEYAFILDTVHMKNAAAINAGEMDVSELGAKAIDDYTLEVELELPCSYFLGLLAFASFFPLNEEFYMEHQDTYAQSIDDMIYCGPYAMSDWQQGNEYTFTKRDDYFKYDEDAVDTITFKFIQDTQSALLAYQQGDIDLVHLQSEQVDQYQDDEGFSSRLQSFIWYLSLNFENENIQNDNLREALAYGVDRETIVNDVLKDGSISADGIIPKEFAYNSEGTDFRDDAGVITEYDSDKAAEYYAAAVEELGGDVTIELLFEDSEASKAVAENIQAQWQTACPGLTVTLNSKPKKTRLELMGNGEYEVALTRWGPDYADPETYMDLFLSTNLANNQGHYSNAEYDALVTSAGSGEDALDEMKRWQDYIDAEKILIDEDHGVIPVYQNGGAVVINPKVTNIKFHTVGIDDYRHIYKAD